MRKWIVTAAIAAAGTVVIGSSTARANLLVAPGFEFGTGAPDATNADSNTPITAAGQNPWFGPRSGAQAYSSSVNPFSGSSPARNRIGSGGQAAYQGNQYAYAYSTGNTFGYVAQSVTGAAIVPGDTYTASAYFNNKAATGTDGDRLQGGSNDTVRMVFLDSGGATLSTAISAPFGNEATPTYNVWTPLSVSAAAPAGTATIIFQAYLTRGTAGGVMFVDAADLFNATAVAPEPSALAALVAGVAVLARRRRHPSAR